MLMRLKVVHVGHKMKLNAYLDQRGETESRQANEHDLED
jgi:hypothetical protein